MTLLSVSDLSVAFDTDRGRLQAVDGVDFAVERGETLCLVGESGSGKTVACESLTRLLPKSTDISGTVEFDGQDLLSASGSELRSVRGDRIAHVFQNPQGALDPVYTVGDQIAEAIQIHQEVPERQARERAVDLLERVGIPDPGERVDEYPHEFSGGMRQRVVIAIALASDPDLLVCDEPTTALDVTIQARILDLIRELQAERDMAVLFITHNLGVVAQLADRVAVMYAGKVMERGDVYDVFDRPAHPYTRALLECLPRADRDPTPIEGSFPDPTDPPEGCRFAPRCPHAVADCRGVEHPPEEPVDRLAQSVHGGGADHLAACVFYDDHHDASRIAPADADEGESMGADGGGPSGTDEGGGPPVDDGPEPDDGTTAPEGGDDD